MAVLFVFNFIDYGNAYISAKIDWKIASLKNTSSKSKKIRAG